MRKEDKISQQVAAYLNWKHPGIMYHFDVGSGGVTSIGMAVRNKSLNKWRGYPDLFIAYPCGGYSGLFIELKVNNPFKKDGNIKADAHLQEQNSIHIKLREFGYKAEFGVGFEGCVKIIDSYLLNQIK